MESLAFLVVAVGILGFGLVSGRVQRSVLTPPMAFVAFGLVVGVHGLNLLDVDINESVIHTLAELTLVLVLFTDASRIDLRLLRKDHDLPVQMLLVGMPLTIVLGAALALPLFPELGFWGALILAAVLAPTDAALGQAVVSSPTVPKRIRQALNVESGLNDGIALPVVLILLSVGCATAHPESLSYWIQFTSRQLILGPLVGVVVGFFGGRLVQRAASSGWMNPTFESLSALGLALLAYAGAEAVGGNGFIAAFSAGLVLGNTSRQLGEALYEFAEAEGQLLTLLVFLLFGAFMAPEALAHMNGNVVLYAVLSLTVVRMVPVSLSLARKKLRWETHLFLGWFGPRGLASILFALLVIDRSTLPTRHDMLIIVMATVLLSVFAHGISANPGAAWYARRTAPRDDVPACVEQNEVSEMPVRFGGS